MAFLSLDGTAIVQLVNFAIFFAVLNVVFLRPVGRAIRRRREYINSVTSDYDRYQAEAAALRTQAEGLRAAARREGEEMLARARADVSDESSKIAAQYAKRALQTIEEAHGAVQGEVDAARANEEQTVRELADLMVRRTLPEAAA